MKVYEVKRVNFYGGVNSEKVFSSKKKKPLILFFQKVSALHLLKEIAKMISIQSGILKKKKQRKIGINF